MTTQRAADDLQRGQRDPLARLRFFAAHWWVPLLVGVLSAAAGVAILAIPEIGLVTLVLVAGAFLLVDGGFDLLQALTGSTAHRGRLALLGALSVIVGIVLVRHPFSSVVGFALFLGIWLIVFGLVRLTDVADVDEHRLWWLAVAIVEVLAGIAIVAFPGIGVGALALLVGITYIVRGAGLASVAWALRRVRGTPRRP